MKVSPVREKYHICSLASYRKPEVSMSGGKISLKNKLVFKGKNSKIFQVIKKGLIDYASHINYTWQHKKAFLKVEKELCGKNSISAFFHDSDKLLMYMIGIPHKTAHNIHVKFAPHHVHNGHVKKPIMTVIDWECARYTKPDKPLTAREFYESFYVVGKNIRIPEIEEALEKLGL